MLETRISWGSGAGTPKCSTGIIGSDVHAVQRSFLGRGLPASTQVLVERLDRRAVIASCVTLADEVIRWNPAASALPRPTAGILAQTRKIDRVDLKAPRV